MIREHAAKDLFAFQSMQRGTAKILKPEPNYDFWDTSLFEKEGLPLMYFIEHSYAGDPTNWWIPNLACVQALLRSSGFTIIAHPEEEVFICRCAAS